MTTIFSAQPAGVIKTYTLSRAVVEFWDNGIVYYKVYDNTEVTLDIAREQYVVLRDNYIHPHKFKVLFDPGKFTTVTKEAREYAARRDINEITQATAVIIHSLAQRIITNFHANYIRRIGSKMKAFQSKEEATNWLLDIPRRRHFRK